MAAWGTPKERKELIHTMKNFIAAIDWMMQELFKMIGDKHGK